MIGVHLNSFSFVLKRVLKVPSCSRGSFSGPLFIPTKSTKMLLYSPISSSDAWKIHIVFPVQTCSCGSSLIYWLTATGSFVSRRCGLRSSCVTSFLNHNLTDGFTQGTVSNNMWEKPPPWGVRSNHQTTAVALLVTYSTVVGTSPR